MTTDQRLETRFVQRGVGCQAIVPLHGDHVTCDQPVCYVVRVRGVGDVWVCRNCYNGLDRATVEDQWYASSN